jgi:hypothetical protein
MPRAHQATLCCSAIPAIKKLLKMFYWWVTLPSYLNVNLPLSLSLSLSLPLPSSPPTPPFSVSLTSLRQDLAMYLRLA